MTCDVVVHILKYCFSTDAMKIHEKCSKCMTGLLITNYNDTFDTFEQNYVVMLLLHKILWTVFIMAIYIPKLNIKFTTKYR